MARLRTAVIGVGHLGKEHARILAGFPEVELVGVADINFEQAQIVARRCGTRPYRNHQMLIDLVDAATIAAPTTNHVSIANEFMNRGIPVLVEKPLAETVEGADSLVSTAHRHGVMLQVGHIERFNPTFEEVQGRGLRPRFVECERLGPFSGRSTDIGVVLDLMIHDIDLLLELFPVPVQTVDAIGWTVHGRHEDVAHARLVFADGREAHLSASRVSATPRRHMRIWADNGYVGLDFAARSVTLVESSEQLRKQGLELWRQQPFALRQVPELAFGSHLRLIRPQSKDGDQLTRELRDFVRSIQTGIPPRVPGEAGRKAVAVASRVLDCLRRRPNSEGRGAVVPWYQAPESEAAA